MRKLVFAILFPFLTGCASNVSASPGQDHVAYVQIGDSSQLKVDLEGQKSGHILDSMTPTVSAEVHVINHDNDDMNVSSLAPLEGCWRLRAQWKALPVQFGPIGAAITSPDSFVVASDVLIDLRKSLYLSGVCPKVITSAVTNGDVLLFSRKEVTGAFSKQGRVLGLEYSDQEIVARADARGAPPSDISHLIGKVRALSLDPLTGSALVIREVSRTAAEGWLRALAGHPKQTSEYDLVVIDKLTRVQKIIKLGPGKSGQTVKIWFKKGVRDN